DVQTLVALQANQLAPERLRHHLADLGLADARLALEKERPAHGEREEKRGGKAAVGHILAGSEQGLRLIDRLRECLRHGKRLKERHFARFVPAPLPAVRAFPWRGPATFRSSR